MESNLMELQERIKAKVDVLKARGVVDIKLHIDPVEGATYEGLLNEIDEILTCVIEGRHHPAAPMNDSQRHQEEPCSDC